MSRIKVNLADRSYGIEIGHDTGQRLGTVVQKQLGEARLFLFFDANFYVLHGATLKRQLAVPAKRVSELVLPSGERHKTPATVTQVQNFLLSEQISRGDLILACGGGVLTDLVGYSAATVLRGVAWGAVPTTLLGLVDAAIGGKTGVNHRHGKNLIGAIWQPSFVHADLAWLRTLPFRELNAGLGEVVKYAGLSAGTMVQRISKLKIEEVIEDPSALLPLVSASVRYKAKVVANDERERGQRMILNLGHTFAHGIEKALGYGRLRHGEAVLLGLLAMWHLSVARQKRVSREMTAYRSIIEQFIRHIPYRQVDPEAVVAAMTTDKKRIGRTLRFVLLSRPGKPFIDSSVTPARARKALRAALATYRECGGRNAANTGR